MPPHAEPFPRLPGTILGAWEEGPPCRGGCGLSCAPGLNPWGQSFDTCCRGCALGRGHDPGCRGTVCSGAGTDAEVAMALQMEEMQVQQTEQTERRFADEQERRFRRLADPMWGEVVLPPGKEPSCRLRCCFALCPCAVVGITSTSARRSWRQFVVSWSMATAVLQVALLLIALGIHGGFAPLSENPMLGPPYYVLDVLGAKNVARIRSGGEWWRLLSPVLLHTGVFHLLGNLLVQLRTGSQLEVTWGHGNWLFIYVVSGGYASLTSCVMLPGGLSVGSSGSLCGLIGAWLAFTVMTWNQTLPHDVPERDQQVVSIIVSLAVIIGLSFLPLMDFGAHLGGMVAGAFLAMAIFAGRIQHEGYKLATRACGVGSTLCLGFGLLFWLRFVTPVDERLLHICGPEDVCR